MTIATVQKLTSSKAETTVISSLNSLSCAVLMLKCYKWRTMPKAPGPTSVQLEAAVNELRQKSRHAFVSRTARLSHMISQKIGNARHFLTLFHVSLPQKAVMLTGSGGGLGIKDPHLSLLNPLFKSRYAEVPMGCLPPGSLCSQSGISHYTR